MTQYDLDTFGMPEERVYDLLNKGMAYEAMEKKCESCPIVEKTLESLCGMCDNSPLDRKCQLRVACPKRGSVKRIYAMLDEEKETGPCLG